MSNEPDEMRSDAQPQEHAGISRLTRAAAAAEAPAKRAGAGPLGAFLAGQDVPCPRCGYNLRDLAGDRCPECGDGLRLQIGLVEPRLGPYLMLLATCCVGLGGSTLFMLLALKAAPSDWWWRPAAMCLLAQFAVTGVLLPGIVLRRRSIRKLPERRQWTLAGLLAAAVVGLSAGVVLAFRS